MKGASKGTEMAILIAKMWYSVLFVEIISRRASSVLPALYFYSTELLKHLIVYSTLLFLLHIVYHTILFLIASIFALIFLMEFVLNVPAAMMT